MPTKDVAGEVVDEDEADPDWRPSHGGRHTWPQRIFRGVVRRSSNSENPFVTFEVRVWRIIVLNFVVQTPRPGKRFVPVTLRVGLDHGQEDKPGTIVIDG